MTAETTSKARIGLVGGVVRGRCPYRICRHWLTRVRHDCGACRSRPIEDVDISYGSEPSLDLAIAKGLTTRADIEAFRREITGG
jgi:hypothetical protein